MKKCTYCQTQFKVPAYADVKPEEKEICFSCRVNSSMVKAIAYAMQTNQSGGFASREFWIKKLNSIL